MTYSQQCALLVVVGLLGLPKTSISATIQCASSYWQGSNLASFLFTPLGSYHRSIENLF